MTAEQFRRIALGLTDAVEGAHMGHPDFRVTGGIFATLHTGDKYGMVKLPPEEQERFVRDYPDVFTPESGAWGRQGCTRVVLAAADEDTVGEAITLAWQQMMKTRAARAVKPKRKPSTVRQARPRRKRSP